MNPLNSRPQLVRRLRGHVIVTDEPDGVATLFWSPDFSVFQDAEGNERHLWSLESQATAQHLCRVTNVRFVDCSKSLHYSS